MKDQNNYFFSIENNSYDEVTKETERYVSGYYRTFDEVQRQIEMRAKIHGLDFEIYGTGEPTYNEIHNPAYNLYSVQWFRDGKPVQPHFEGVYMPRFINTHKFN